MDILFYFENIAKIGGIETWTYYLIKDLVKHGKHIRILYKNGEADPKQVTRLKQICPVAPYNFNDRICDIAIYGNYNSSFDIVGDVSIQTIHANFSELPHLKLKCIADRYVAVSETTKECAKGFDIDVEVLENYIPEDLEYEKRNEKRDYIKIISATRLTEEKGYLKMLKLGKLLKKEGIPYKWYVYTTDNNKIDEKLFIKMTPRLDILDEIANSDYVVQFSDTESYCYTVHEALAVQTPIIINEWLGNPLTKDNGYSYKQVMENPHIIKNIPKGFEFHQDGSVQKWLDYLDKIEKEIQEERKNTKKIKAICNFYAIKEDKHFKIGDIGRVTIARAEELSSENNSVHRPVAVILDD